MRLFFLCATRRGLECLRRARSLRPADDITVFSFPEDAGEPLFLDDIREYCARERLDFVCAKNVGAPEVAAHWAVPPDLIVMVHWRYLLPGHLPATAPRGAVVFHDSLLPAYRGFSPTVWAMINGETRCGATMLFAEDEMDAGDIIDQEAVDIGPEDTIADVFARTTDAYLSLLDRNLGRLLDGTAPRRAQDHAMASYTCARTPDDARIDWRRPAAEVHNLIRASTRPYSGAFSTWKGQKLTVWSAARGPGDRPYAGIVPGRVAQIIPGRGVLVLAADGPILLKRVQLGDGPEVDAWDVLKSVRGTLGES